jgi:hypothetical protein
MKHSGISGAAAIGLVACVSSFALAQDPAPDDVLRVRLLEVAERVVFPERCGECHASEHAVWQDTPHATGFDTLHTSDRAKEIYRALGLRLIKRGTEETTPACLECHYTPEVRRDTLRAGAGVTCESCHGPARDWVGVHNSYGVAEADFQRAALLETPEHREQRIADSRAAGMRRPSDLYEVVANCFGCHTVPKETLVNVAGHSTGSDFELVDWSERIRHNFLESYKTGDGRTNADRSVDRKRVMYVVGRALDLEYSLRGVAVATEDELYFGAMSDRAGGAIDELFYLNDTVAIPAVQTIIDTFDGVDLRPNNRVALLAAADAVQAATRSFIASSDAAALAAVDRFWDPDATPPASTTSASGARPAPAPTRVTEVSTPLVGAAAGVAGPSGPDPTDTEPRTTAPASPSPSVVDQQPQVAARQYEVSQRPTWRDGSDHAFVKVPCGKCHTQQQAWWQKDTHRGTAEPLRNGDADAARIATLYGIDPADMAKGDQTCMWCHGTIVGAPGRKVRPGVGCQRCHGAGADYLAPHETESFAQSIGRGLTDLETPAVRAGTCAGCHYITDPGLLAAGHGDGADFDIVERMNEIRHWGVEFGRDNDDGVASAALATAHAAVITERGPPPAVERLELIEPTASGPPIQPPVGSPGARSGSGGAVSRSPRERVQPTRTRVRRAEPARVPDPGLGPTVVDPDASPEETLLWVKTRLEALFRAVGRGPVQ